MVKCKFKFHMNCKSIIAGAENLGGRGGNVPSTLQGGGRAPSPYSFTMLNRLLLVNSNKSYLLKHVYSTLTSVNQNTEFVQAIPITRIVNCTNSLELLLEHGIMAKADVFVSKFVKINLNKSL